MPAEQITGSPWRATLYTPSDGGAATHAIAYLLMPIDLPQQQIEDWCQRYGTAIVIVSGMDWDNDLTPWPAPGVPKGSPDFKGRAAQFLQVLEVQIALAAEQGLAIKTRNLVGVSLSGLFAVWAWMQDDFFANIASLSGSFWYEGFVEWLYSEPLPTKTGRAFFELGVEEPHSRNRTFATVGTRTDSVIQRLRQLGIDCQFQWVPGNHYSPIEPRLTLAMEHI